MSQCCRPKPGALGQGLARSQGPVMAGQWASVSAFLRRSGVKVLADPWVRREERGIGREGSQSAGGREAFEGPSRLEASLAPKRPKH